MTSAPGMFSLIMRPRRRATSRQRSFSMRPDGPIVPFSYPPWPGWIAMRLILRPSSRARESRGLLVTSIRSVALRSGVWRIASWFALGLVRFSGCDDGTIGTRSGKLGGLVADSLDPGGDVRGAISEEALLARVCAGIVAVEMPGRMDSEIRFAAR